MTIIEIAALRTDRLAFLWDVFTASVVLLGGADIMVEHLNALVAKCDPSMFAASRAEATRIASEWARYQPPRITRHVETSVTRYDSDSHSDRAAPSYCYSIDVVTSVDDRNSYRRGMSAAWSEDARKAERHRNDAMEALAIWKASVEEFVAGKRRGRWQALRPEAALRVRESFAEGARPLGEFERYWASETEAMRLIAAAISKREKPTEKRGRG